MGKISLVKSGVDIESDVRRSIDLVGGLKVRKGMEVVVKPNVCNPKNPQGMVITDFGIVGAVIKLLKEMDTKPIIVESDNIAGSAEARVRDSGLLAKLEEWGVEFRNLSKEEGIPHTVAGEEIVIPKMLLNSKYFINLPKIKTCAHTLVTLGIKNLYGCFTEAKKSKYHKKLDEILPFLAKTIRSDFIVVDGLTCMEGNGPTVGNPRKMGVIVSGTDVVEVDSFCSKLMGFDPKNIGHIAKAMDADMVPSEIVGDPWEGFVCRFEKPYSIKATLKSIKTLRDVYLSP